jgi:hypothetical protein
MAKFVVVSEAPTGELEKGVMVIGQPDFLPQVLENQKKAPKHHQTGINHLREVLNSIGQKYDQDMNVYKIRMSNYEGLPFKTNEDLNTIVTQILRNEYPQLFGKYLEFQLKNRPMNTKLVYYVGNLTETGPFYSAGLDLLDEKDVESYLTGKPKKIVGKPAVSNET